MKCNVQKTALERNESCRPVCHVSSPSLQHCCSVSMSDPVPGYLALCGAGLLAGMFILSIVSLLCTVRHTRCFNTLQARTTNAY